MKKLLLACRRQSCPKLLERLYDLEAVELIPITTVAPLDSEELQQQKILLDQLFGECEALGIPATDEQPPISQSNGGLTEILEHFERYRGYRSELTAVELALEKMGPWTQVDGKQLQILHQTGRQLRVFQLRRPLKKKETSDFSFQHNARHFAAALNVEPQWRVQTQSVEVAISAEKLATLQERKIALQQNLAKGAEAIRAAAHSRDHLISLKRSLLRRLALTLSLESVFEGDEIVAVEGWVAEERVRDVHRTIADSGIAARALVSEPLPGDRPPTAIRYHRGAASIRGLMKMLGILPGPGEPDVSLLVLAALAAFSAMLISDAGYGLVIILGALWFRHRKERGAARDLPNLFLVIGVACVLWGILISSFLGFSVNNHGSSPFAALRIFDAKYAHGSVIELMLRASFIIGMGHMALAELMQGYRHRREPIALAHLGWAVFLLGVLMIVMTLVLGDAPSKTLAPILACGATLAIAFGGTGRSPARRLLTGLASFPLRAIGCLSDVISYVRLVAVGLASTILATTFNELTVAMADSYGIFAGAVVGLFGHSLNLGLGLVAIFAHGVRLNLLEFSGHLGVQWGGRPFVPLGSNELEGGPR